MMFRAVLAVALFCGIIATLFNNLAIGLWFAIVVGLTVGAAFLILDGLLDASLGAPRATNNYVLAAALIIVGLVVIYNPQWFAFAVHIVPPLPPNASEILK